MATAVASAGSPRARPAALSNGTRQTLGLGPHLQERRCNDTSLLPHGPLEGWVLPGEQLCGSWVQEASSLGAVQRAGYYLPRDIITPTNFIFLHSRRILFGLAFS